MTEPKKHDIVIKQGAKYQDAFHWYGGGKKCQAIENVTVGHPTIITATAHGLPTVSDTPISIMNVYGARNLNTGTMECDRVKATVIDADTFSVDVDTGYQRYKAGTGSFEWYQPKALSGYTAQMQIREQLEDVTPLISLSSQAGDIVISVQDARITFTIATAVTEQLDFSSGVYDLELIDTNGEATRLLEGNVTLSKEVTR
jgi:hypothetical protein